MINDSKNLRALLDNVLDIVIRLDEKLNIVYCNHAFSTFLGFKQNEIIDKSFVDFVYESDKFHIAGFLNPLLQGTELICRNTVRLVAKNKNIFFFEGHAQPFLNSDNIIIGISCVLRDVSQNITLNNIQIRSKALMKAINNATVALLSDEFNDSLLQKSIAILNINSIFHTIFIFQKDLIAKPEELILKCFSSSLSQPFTNEKIFLSDIKNEKQNLNFFDSLVFGEGETKDLQIFDNYLNGENCNFINLPIIINGLKWGCLLLIYNVEQEMPLSEEDKIILQNYSASVSGAISQIELYNNFQKTKANLILAQDLAKIGSFSFNLQNLQWSWSSEFEKIMGIENLAANDAVNQFENSIVEYQREEISNAYHNAVVEQSSFDLRYKVNRLSDNKEVTVHSIGKIIKDENSNSIELIGSMQDISEQSNLQATLERRLNYIEMITKFSTKLISLDLMTINETINEILVFGSQYCGAERALVFTYSNDRKQFHCNHFWSQKSNDNVLFEKIRQLDVNLFPEDYVILLQEDSVFMQSNVSLNFEFLSQELLQIIEISETKSYIHFPMYLGSRTLGFIALETYSKEKIWNDEEIQSFRLISDIINNAIIRLYFETTRQEYISTLDKTFGDLHQSKEELLELNKTKDKFFSIIAHDLKSPFTAFIGMLEVLNKKMFRLSLDEIYKLSNDIRESALNLYELLENLLDWSRIQRGILPNKPEIYDLEEVVEQVLKLAKYNADNKNIEVQTKFEKEVYVFVDEHILSTILRNIIFNAIKFTNKNGRVTVKFYKIDSQRAELQVEDTGIGMSDEQLKNLFNLEIHHTKLGTDFESGTGLGVNLAKELSMLAGGDLKVTSQLGKGTKFALTLNLANEFSV